MNKILTIISWLFVAFGIWIIAVDGYSGQSLLSILFFSLCGLVFTFNKRFDKWTDQIRRNQLKKTYCKIESDHFNFPKGYYYKHSSINDKKKLYYEEIEEIRITYPPCAKINGKELIFLLGLTGEEIIDVSNKNNIPIAQVQDNWYLICEEYLDTEFDPEHKEETLVKLEQSKISKDEVRLIRKRFSKRMLITTMFSMEWVYYGQFDILEHICPLTSKKYWWTMEIALRK